MPKAKRDKKISLTQTDKKGFQLKQKTLEDVRNCVQEFNHIYVFTYANVANRKLQIIREEMKPDRFFFGKKAVIGLGLGRNKEDEIADGVHKINKILVGQCALFFSNKPHEETMKWFKTFSYTDFARSGYKVDKTVELKEGPLEFSFAIEPYLRQLGLPTKLEKGVVVLLKDYTVCKKGSNLTPEQAKILQLLNMKMATIKLHVTGYWIKGKGFKRIIKKVKTVEKMETDD